MALIDGLIHQYRLENNFIDDLGSQNLQSEGGALQFKNTTPAPFEGDYSAYSGGSNSFTNQASLVNNADFTVAFWYYHVSTPTNGNIFGIRADSVGNQKNAWFVFRFNPAPTVASLVKNTDLQSANQSSSYSGHAAAGWRYYICKRIGDTYWVTARFPGGYVDILTATLTGSWWEAGDWTRWGAFFGSTESVTGYYDLIAIWNRGISTDEEIAMFNNGNGKRILLSAGFPFFFPGDDD